MAFPRRHEGVIVLGLLFLGYVLHDRPALRETIGASSPTAASGIALMALTLPPPPVTRSTALAPGTHDGAPGARATGKPVWTGLRDSCTGGGLEGCT
ncbi:hypothetical protein [Streptomyces sp. CB02261]|uniref:hypothetical protein n=1 Tax=Streptomyces sp. CB02261 TaxID=1703940 RepID=UPI00093A3E9E|nr:hypothetical protein [Streptomyces sp. CB02261]OKJ52539.1 hypothetical protein AMK29_30370 [Streptomyces sp. CB02261]